MVIEWIHGKRRESAKVMLKCKSCEKVFTKVMNQDVTACPYCGGLKFIAIDREVILK